MKKVNKLKKNFVINTNFVKNENFNEPVYVIDAGKDFITAYNTDKKNKVNIEKVEITPELDTKTFIKVKDFFKKCKLNDQEYRLKNAKTDNVYLRIAYLGDISLFLKINEKENTLFMTNINKYDFYPSKLTKMEALNKIPRLNDFDKLKINAYTNNIRNLKRDFMFVLQNSLENLERRYKESQSEQNKKSNNTKQSSKK